MIILNVAKLEIQAVISFVGALAFFVQHIHSEGHF